MSRRVRRKGWLSRDREKAVVIPHGFPRYSDAAEDCGGSAGAALAAEVDWTGLPDDTVLHVFCRLNYRDRASLASTCRHFRLLGSSPCLWNALDIRMHRCDPPTALSLAMRCSSLSSLQFRGPEAAAAIMHLQARGLRGVSGESCQDLTDSTLSILAARHEFLESLQIGPEACLKLTSDAIKAVALCCPKLRRLRLSGLWDIKGEAIRALAKNCKQLEEIAFLECEAIESFEIAEVASLRFLSVAGARNVNWAPVCLLWSKLPHLVGLDVSRTDISPSALLKLASSKSLKVLNALNCPAIEEENDLQMSTSLKGKVLLHRHTDIFKGVDLLYRASNAACKKDEDKKFDVLEEWRNTKKKGHSSNIDDLMYWLEWVLSHSLIRIAELNPLNAQDFWLGQGARLLLSLVRSSQEDVQERAITCLGIFVVTDDDNASVDPGRSEAVMRDGGIPMLLEFARSCREGVQSEAAKALANLSVNAKVAKAVADRGGIKILAELARSKNKIVAEEAAGGLWNLSVGEEHKGAIAEAGGIKVLVDIILQWPSGTDGVLERAAGALANLAADDKCSMEVAVAGGVHALVMLAKYCKVEGVQEQAARALANLAAHGDTNSNNSAVGQEAGALEALVQLTCSPSEGVRQEAAGALWNLSFDDRNREAIAAVGGVEALVALAQSCLNASQGLQERAAGALWGLSVSEANSDAIGREGGVPPLIALARSDVEDVHETAAGALWNLAFNPGNALRIIGEGGVAALVHLCSSSGSKMARFMAALALAYMFDGRMDEVALVGTSSEGTSKTISLDGFRRMALKHIEAFVCSFSDPQAFAAVAASSAPASLVQVTEAARIHEAGHLRCSGAEIVRFVVMLRNPSPILRSCAAFALVQFTIPGGRHTPHHVYLIQNAGAGRILRTVAASTTAPIEAKIFARMVLRNLELHQL